VYTHPGGFSYAFLKKPFQQQKVGLGKSVKIQNILLNVTETYIFSFNSQMINKKVYTVHTKLIVLIKKVLILLYILNNNNKNLLRQLL
jgi:hypothetical protein